VIQSPISRKQEPWETCHKFDFWWWASVGPNEEAFGLSHRPKIESYFPFQEGKLENLDLCSNTDVQFRYLWNKQKSIENVSTTANQFSTE
jgi:hypothetical protein